MRCPVCGSASIYVDALRERWECRGNHPKRTFTAKTGTIFEDSALTLDKWLVAIWMAANAPDGANSHELARTIGVTQKTAWWMLKKIDVAVQALDEREHPAPPDKKPAPDKKPVPDK